MHQTHDVVTQLVASTVQGGILVLAQMDDDLQLSHIVHFFYVLLANSAYVVYQLPAAAPIVLQHEKYHHSCTLMRL